MICVRLIQAVLTLAAAPPAYGERSNVPREARLFTKRRFW